MRITFKRIEELVDTIREIESFKNARWSTIKGEPLANLRASHGNGNVCLYVTLGERGGIREIFFGTTREAHTYLTAILAMNG